MSFRVWPHLPQDAARVAFQGIQAGESLDSAQLEGQRIWPAVGSRVESDVMEGLVRKVREAAGRFGFPGPISDRDKTAFDRAVTRALRAHVKLPYGEAGSADTWAYITFVLLPAETRWRFETTRERWLYEGSGVRHAWARLWWQAEAFDDRFEILDGLSESELIPMFERTGISSSAPLLRAAFGAYLALEAEDRRLPLLRDFAKRLSRMLAFIEPDLLDADAIDALIREPLGMSLRSFQRSTAGSPTLVGEGGAIVDAPAPAPAEDEVISADEPPEILRRARAMLQPYNAFVVPAGMPPMDRMNGRAAHAIVLAAVRLEGPVLMRRLERCVLGDEGSKVASACEALSAAVAEMTESSLLVITRAGLNEPVLTTRGGRVLALRRRGARRFDEIPGDEIRAAAELTTGVFELFDVPHPTPDEEERLSRLLPNSVVPVSLPH